MKGSTNWLVRPGDEISVEEKLGYRWIRSGLAELAEPAEKMETLPEIDISLEQLRDLARLHDLPIRGTKAELAQRLTEAGVVINPVEEPVEPELTAELETELKSTVETEYESEEETINPELS